MFGFVLPDRLRAVQTGASWCNPVHFDTRGSTSCNSCPVGFSKSSRRGKSTRPYYLWSLRATSARGAAQDANVRISVEILQQIFLFFPFARCAPQRLPTEAIERKRNEPMPTSAASRIIRRP
jgi:hypothetical protein